MWAFRVKSLDQPVYEVALVEIAGQKSDRRQPTQRLAGRRRMPCGNFIEKPFEERTELPICASPVASRVRADRLLKVTLWHREAMFYEKSVNLALRCRQTDIDRKGAP